MNLSTLPVAWCEPLVARLPSHESLGAGFRRNDELLSSGAPHSIVHRVRARIHEQIEGYYGYYKDSPNASAPTQHPIGISLDPANPPGGFFGPSACNAARGEVEMDHVGRSCGNAIQIRVKIDASTLPGTDCLLPSPEPQVKVILDQTHGLGTLETGYFRGALVQAMSCFEQEVLNEIRDKKMIQVDALGERGDAPSPCSAIAEDYGNLIRATQSITEKISKEPNGNLILAAMGSDCATSEMPSQSAKFLCSSRQALETQFSQLAVCQILSKSQLAYENNVNSSAAHDKLIAQLTEKVTRPCSQATRRRFSPSGASCIKKPNETELNDFVNQCYRQYLPGWARDYFGALWPTHPTPANSCRLGAPRV